MTGILVVIRLKQVGIDDVVLLEKKDSVGGTWRENTYPAVACDVPGHAYTYAFEPNPEWSSLFAPGAEIHQYFKDVCRKYDVDRHIRYGETVTGCVYQDGRWNVKTQSGGHYACDLLFAATGMLHRPVTPDFPGRESFAGVQMHSAEWDHSVDMRGKRIGVVGNGSSAAQLIPELIDTEGTAVSVFQRTAQWMVTMPNRAYTEKQRRRFRTSPRALARTRRLSLLLFEFGTAALTSDGFFMRMLHRLMAWNGRRYLNSAIKDPELKKKLTPDYTFGCKRVVINSTFYPAIQKPNADRKSTRLNSSHSQQSRMPSSA